MSERIVIRTEAAPAPFQGAPYSQAIRNGDLVFVSGQLGLKPGDTAISGSIGDQTEQIFQNLKAILEEAGSGLTDLGNFLGMNEVYARHVGEDRPARSTVEISALPSGALVEIEAIATV
jgi:2-iminobutanoate/2-iminopropanoate deaminase